MAGIIGEGIHHHEIVSATIKDEICLIATFTGFLAQDATAF